MSVFEVRFRDGIKTKTTIADPKNSVNFFTIDFGCNGMTITLQPFSRCGSLCVFGLFSLRLEPRYPAFAAQRIRLRFGEA